MRNIVMTTALLLASMPLLQIAPAAAQPAAPAKGAPYSVSTTLVGTLLEDAAAAAIIKELAPTVYENSQFQTDGRALTLKEIQQYEPNALSDEVLAKMQLAFDKLPPKS